MSGSCRRPAQVRRPAPASGRPVGTRRSSRTRRRGAERAEAASPRNRRPRACPPPLLPLLQARRRPCSSCSSASWRPWAGAGARTTRRGGRRRGSPARPRSCSATASRRSGCTWRPTGPPPADPSRRCAGQRGKRTKPQQTTVTAEEQGTRCCCCLLQYYYAPVLLGCGFDGEWNWDVCSASGSGDQDLL
jgi:hypothetical protein